MPVTTSEAVLAALAALLQGVGVPVLRNDPLPTSVPVGGLIILRDGDPGEPEFTMSPPVWQYDHRAVIEVLVQKASGRDLIFDGLKASIGALLSANRNLGGLAMWCEPQAPQVMDMAIEGAASVKAAEIGVMLTYLTSDPLA